MLGFGLSICDWCDTFLIKGSFGNSWAFLGTFVKCQNNLIWGIQPHISQFPIRITLCFTDCFPKAGHWDQFQGDFLHQADSNHPLESNKPACWINFILQQLMVQHNFYHQLICQTQWLMGSGSAGLHFGRDPRPEESTHLFGDGHLDKCWLYNWISCKVLLGFVQQVSQIIKCDLGFILQESWGHGEILFICL